MNEGEIFEENIDVDVTFQCVISVCVRLPEQGPQGKMGMQGLPGIDGPPVSTSNIPVAHVLTDFRSVRSVVL